VHAWALGWERLWEDTTKSASLPSETGSTTSLTTHKMSNLHAATTLKQSQIWIVGLLARSRSPGVTIPSML
jgi:hypothetical protein